MCFIEWAADFRISGQSVFSRSHVMNTDLHEAHLVGLSDDEACSVAGVCAARTEPESLRRQLDPNQILEEALDVRGVRAGLDGAVDRARAHRVEEVRALAADLQRQHSRIGVQHAVELVGKSRSERAVEPT